MSITIKRETNWMGTATNHAVKINGKKVATIANHREVTLDLPEESARLKVTQLDSRSKEIEVKDGDMVEVTTKKESTWFFWAMIISTFMINVTDFGVFFFSLVLIFAVVFVVYPHLELTVVDQQSTLHEEEMV